METFLQIVGGIVLGLTGLFILLIVIGYFYLRRRMGQFGQSYAGMMEAAEAVSQTVPSFRVKLEPANHREWINTEDFEAICEELDSRGFVRIGRFASMPPTVLLEAWHLPAESLFVTIYEHPVGGLWLDAGYEFEDGSIFTYSSGPNHHMGTPPWSTFEFRTGTPTAELLDAVIADRPDRPALPTSAESFPDRFESQWAREMDWRIERGGPTADEIRKTLEDGIADESSSKEEASTAIKAAAELNMVEQIHSMWRDRINEFRSTQVRESFLTSSRISALEWDRIRDRAIFIHDGLTGRDLAEHLEQYLYADLAADEEHDIDDDEYERMSGELAEQLNSRTARELFAESVANQTTEKRHEKIGEVTEPVDADVWVSPQFADDRD